VELWTCVFTHYACHKSPTATHSDWGLPLLRWRKGKPNSVQLNRDRAGSSNSAHATQCGMALAILESTTALPKPSVPSAPNPESTLLGFGVPRTVIRMLGCPPYISLACVVFSTRRSVCSGEIVVLRRCTHTAVDEIDPDEIRSITMRAAMRGL
jgi:hypothetical protein